MARPYQFAAQGETPSQIFDGGVCELQTIFAHNPSEVAGAYVKLYASADAPTGSSVPIFAVWVPPGAVDSGGADRVIPAFVGGGNWWVAVATEAAAGLTAPDEDFEITITLQG